MEHIIDNTPISNETSNSIKNSNNDNNKNQINQIITREEREVSLMNNYKKAFNITLENLTINKIENSKDNNPENSSVLEDDNISIASSKILTVGNKAFKNSRLPLIFGTKEFISARYLGLVDESNQPNVDVSNKSTNNNPNINNKDNNLVASPENSNSRSQTTVYDNPNNNTNNTQVNMQNQNKLNNHDNYNYYRHYEHTYDYNNSRPSMVSEIARPNFQQLVDQEISLGLNKKTSMEFNLMNNNNNINFMRNQSLLIPNDNYSSSNKTNNTPQDSNTYNRSNISNHLTQANLRGNIPEAPVLPIVLLQKLKKIPRPQLSSSSTIYTKNMNLDIHLTSNQNSEMIKNQNLIEKSNLRNKNYNENELNPSSLINQEIYNNSSSFKDNLNMKLGGLRGKQLIMPQTRNSMMDNNSNEVDTFMNDDRNIYKSNLNQNIQNNYSGDINQINSNKIYLKNTIVNSKSLNNISQVPANNNFEKPKTVTLNNFVRKSNLFEVEEDDEEDNTGLFRKATSSNINLILNKKNTQSNINTSEEISSNLTNPKNENNYSYKPSSNTNLNDNLFDNNDSKQNLFTKENNIKLNSKLPISSQRSILKTKEAKNTVNSMFADESVDKLNPDEEETTTSINKKTVDITKRLSNIFNLEEENDISIIKRPEINKDKDHKNISIQKNKIDKQKIINNEDEIKQNIISYTHSNKETTEKIQTTNSPLINNLNKDPIKNDEVFNKEKNNIKPDLNKLNKLFLAEEEEEMDFKNINFKKEERRILNPQSKELPKSTEIVKNIENLTSQRNEKFKNDECESNMLINDLKDNNKATQENAQIKNIKINSKNSDNKLDDSISKANKNSNIINHNDSSNKTNTSSENQSKQKNQNVDPLTGAPIPIKKESGNKKNSIKTIADPLSMMRSTVQKKNKIDSQSLTKNIVENKTQSEEINGQIITDNLNKTNQEQVINKKEELNLEEKEDDVIHSNRVSDLSKIMSARMIFPGFPPQKKNDDKKEQDEFRPETLMNINKNDKSYLSAIPNTRKNSNLSQEEYETLNKIVLDRPIIRNKKKQKLKKMILEDNKTKNPDELITNNKEIHNNTDKKEIGKKILFENTKIEEIENHKNDYVDKELLSNDQKRIDISLNRDSIDLNNNDKIKTNNELNLNISSKKIKNKVDLTIKKEDLFDPLSIIAKNNNTKNDEKIKFDNSTSLNKTKKFNLFDDEDDKPAKDKAEDLFKLPGKRNTKILGFLDENDTEDPLTELKKNKTTAGRNEKPTKKRDMTDKLKFLLDD